MKLFLLLISAACFWAGDKVAFQIRTDIAGGRRPAEVIDRFWLDLTSPAHLSLVGVDVLAGLCLVGLLGLVWLYNYAGKGQRRQGEEHGSARWSTARQMRRFTNRDPRQNMVFTSVNKLSLDSRKTQRNLNALVIGSSGSGKSRYYVMPNLAQHNTSFVVTDPKGELLARCGNDLAAAGYAIRVLNLVEPGESDTYNPFAYFDPDRAEIDVAVLTENIMANTAGKKPSSLSNADFWEKAERALLNALVAYIYFTKGPTATLIDVVELLAKMGASETDEAHQSEVDLIMAAVEEEIAAYDADPDEYGPECAAMIDGLRFALSQYTTYTQGAGETKKSVIISLGVRLAPLHMAPLRGLLASDTIAAGEVGDEKTAIFLVIPDTHAAFNFIAAIFYEQMFASLIRVADTAESRRLPIPVQCFMDEFANIGRIPSFERVIAVIRSRGISVSIVIQNLAQLKSHYKDDWETIVGNCDSLLFLGGNEKSTTEYLSKILGKQTIRSTETSQSKGRNGSWSLQDRNLGRDLLSADEIGRLGTDEAVYILRGCQPWRARKLAPIREAGVFAYTPELDDETVFDECFIDWTHDAEA